MLWGFPPGVRRAFWLCLLLHVAVATIVEDTSLSIHYDSTWLIDGNGYNSGGSAHHTNISGGTATYLFTGTAVTLYGVTHIDGAKFSLSIEGGPSQSCTAWRNSSNVWYFRSELCSIVGLDGAARHTLTVTHTDVSGLWLGIDYFDVTLTDPTLSVTRSSTSTSLSVASITATIGSTTTEPRANAPTTYTLLTQTTSSLWQTNTTSSSTQTQTQPQSQTQTQVQVPSTSPTHKPSSNIGGIVGGVLGGIIGLALMCLLGAFAFTRLRQARLQLGTPKLSSVQGHQILPSLQDASTEDRPNIGPGVGPGVFGTGGGNTPGTSFFPAEAAALPPAHHSQATSPNMNMTENHHSFSFIPPPSLPSMIERSASSRVLSSSDTRGASLYPAGVASYAVSRGDNTYGHVFPEDPDPFSSPLPIGENQSDGGGYPRSDIDGWRNAVGSPPPPSYHTRTAGQ